MDPAKPPLLPDEQIAARKKQERDMSKLLEFFERRGDPLDLDWMKRG